MNNTFDRTDMIHIKNFSGQDKSYPNNIPNILNGLNMQDELEKFNDTIEKGTYSIVDEMMRLVTEYPAVREKVGRQPYEIIKALHFKKKELQSLNNSREYAVIDPENPKPFDHGEMENIKNYSGQNPKYTNNIPNILMDLNKRDELENFDDAIKQGPITIVEEIIELFHKYPEVEERFDEYSLGIITGLFVKSHIEDLYKDIGDSEDKYRLQDIIEDEKTPNPVKELIRNEDAAELQNLSEQLREHCFSLFEQQFPDNAKYIRYIKEKNFIELCDELFEYTKEGVPKTKSDLFTDYCKITGMTNDQKIGPIHTIFAGKIVRIFKKMKEDSEIRRIHNESKLYN